jgi:riboflavin-specific deaminase-like protein
MDKFLTEPLFFPEMKERPFFYASYVQTIDGKIFVNRPGYWPIGSRSDYHYFTFLRAHADVILEGKNTALRFGKYTLDTIHSEQFLSMRDQLGKKNPVRYMIATSSPDTALRTVLQNKHSYRPIILTDKPLDESWKEVADEVIIQKDSDGIRIESLTSYFYEQNLKSIFLDTGPTLFMSFLKRNLVDELFITVAPKFFGNSKDTITLGEGTLFGLDEIPLWKLENVKQIGDEVFLNYRRKKDK